MPIRFYEPISGDTELKLWADPDTFVEADLEAELSELLELQALSEEARELTGCSELTRDDFDIQIQDRIDIVRDILDFFGYDNKTLNITAKDGAWFLPVAVENSCGEELGREAGFAIDGEVNTFWQHEDNETHEIDFKIRDYRKRVEKIRIYRGVNARSALNNLDIYIANSVGGLNDPENLHATGVSISTDDAWNEIILSSKGRGKYLRLTGFGSANAVNEVRIREIQVWVTIVEYS